MSPHFNIIVVVEFLNTIPSKFLKFLQTSYFHAMQKVQDL